MKLNINTCNMKKKRKEEKMRNLKYAVIGTSKPVLKILVVSFFSETSLLLF